MHVAIFLQEVILLQEAILLHVAIFLQEVILLQEAILLHVAILLYSKRPAYSMQ
jgi:hypothetical protein